MILLETNFLEEEERRPSRRSFDYTSKETLA
jgi:hypothetical protein